MQKNDVLLAHNATVGKVALYNSSEKAIVGTSLTIYRPNLKRIHPYFLMFFLKSSFFQKQLGKEMKQTTRNQVPITKQKELLFYIPPLKEQIDFVQEVENIESHLKTLKRSRDTMNKLCASLVQRAFKGELLPN